jgi:signal transduction histidine kinase/Tfp pilus assembly protein PilF
MTELEQLRTAIASLSCSEQEKQVAYSLLKRIDKTFAKVRFSYNTTLEATQRLTLLLTATSEDLTIALERGEKRSIELAKSNEEIRRQQQTLEKQAANIQVSNTALHERNIALERLNSEKNEFLGIAAHDLKNPLAAITLWADLLIRHGAHLPSGQLIEKLQNIKQSANHMSTLISNLLDINTIESGGIKLNPKEFDIIEVVRHHCKDYQDRATAKNITIIPPIDLSQEQIMVIADHHYTTEIIDNLLSNAVKYSPLGSTIWVRIDHVQSSPNATSRATTDSVVIAIKDEGPGLSEEDLQKLFTKFARLSAKPTGGESSTGLGLSIVKKLAETMNGNVWCESILGAGSTFYFSLPLEADATTSEIVPSEVSHDEYNEKITEILAFAKPKLRSNPAKVVSPLIEALELCAHSELVAEKAKILRYLGIAHIRLSEFSAAHDYLQESLFLYRQIGDESRQAAVLGNIGLFFYIQSSYDLALQYHEESLHLWQKVGGKLGESQALLNIGLVYAQSGNLYKSQYYYGEAIKIKRLVGDRHGEALVLNNLANVLEILGDNTNALSYYQQSLAIKREIGDRLAEAITLKNIGSLYLRLSYFQLAFDYCQESLELHRSIQNRSGIANSLSALSSILTKSTDDIDKLDTALNYAMQSIKIFREIAKPIGVCDSLMVLANVYRKVGLLKEVLPCLEEALAIAQSIGLIHHEANVHLFFSEYYECIGDTAAALRYYKIFTELKEKIIPTHPLKFDALF